MDITVIKALLRNARNSRVPLYWNPYWFVMIQFDVAAPYIIHLIEHPSLNGLGKALNTTMFCELYFEVY